MIAKKLRALFGPSKKELRAEIARLQGIIIDPEVMNIEIEDGGLNMDLKVPDWATRAMAASFAESLGDAPNWQAFQIGPMPSDKGMLIVTIQKANRESPVELVGRLRKEAEEANKFLDDYSGFMDRIDSQIAEALESIGELPGKPAGMPDRVDAACSLLRCLKPALQREKLRAEEADERYCGILDQRDEAKREAVKAKEIAALRDMRRSRIENKLNKEIARLKVEAEDLETIIENKDRVIEDLNKKTAGHREEVAGYILSIKELRKDAKTARMDAKAEMEFMETQLDKKTKTISDRNKEIDELKKERASLRIDLLNKDEEVRVLKENRLGFLLNQPM